MYNQVMVHYSQFIIIYYVSEYQLPYVINVTHTTPTTHVNRDPMLLKLISLRHYPYFRWVSYIPETTAQIPDAEPSRTARYYNNSKTVTVWDVSHPWEPCSGTLSRLRNLYPRSTQNTDVVSSINFPNLSVSCSFTLYLIQLK